MCLAVPGRIVSVALRDGLELAQVDFDGVRRSVCLATLPGAQVGEWILVHAGFALQRLEAPEAEQRRALWRQALDADA